PVSPGPRNHLGSVWCKGNFEKTRVVHLLDIKFTATTYRSKKSAWNPETCLNWIPELEDTKTEYESGNLPKGNDKKKRRSPADEASEEL
ncbi:21379_t:CDS:2, partial [Gigaspora rosea]